MKKFRKLITLVLVIAMVCSVMTGCSKDEEKPVDGGKNNEVTKQAEKPDDGGDDKPVVTEAPVVTDEPVVTDTPEPVEEKVFTMFAAVPGTECPEDNRGVRLIADKIGASCKVTYLTGQSAEERIGVMIASKEYPDFLDASTGLPAAKEAGVFINIDEYWDDYPNIKNWLSPDDWDKVRDADGHIRIVPQFGIIRGRDTATSHNDEAFWIQKKVLIWDNFPVIKTLEQYFDLLERYKAAHPTTDDGQETVAFSMSSEDWRYFGIENGPLFLLGWPNDGACFVDPTDVTAYDYNTVPEAKQYYKFMAQQFQKGLVHPETYTMSYDQYISLLTSGRVLGIIDQMWNFQTADLALKGEGKDGDSYVPLPITIDGNRPDKWHSPSALDVSNGVGITTSCKDIPGAMKFMNDLLSPEIEKIICWGEEGVDYLVNPDGTFTRNEEQTANWKNPDWVTQNGAGKAYGYFPKYEGMMADGINCANPGNQPELFYRDLCDLDKQLLDGYGYKTFLDFLNTEGLNEPWYPMWSITNAWTTDTDYGMAKQIIGDLKHDYLPRAMMASSDAEFDKIWDEYMTAYQEQVDIEAYLDQLTLEARARAKNR